MDILSIPAGSKQPFTGTANPRDLILEVKNLSVVIATENKQEVTAVDRVTFGIAVGDNVGILGESGSGKSTLALALLRALVPQARVAQGTVRFQGQDFLSLPAEQMRKVRGAQIAMIYQDSSVLNPVIRVGDQVAEVFRAHHSCPIGKCRHEAAQMLDAVGLDSRLIYSAFPHQLSGGQRQRVVIAQALVCHPALVVADEPTASLDPDTAGEVLELLLRLKKQLAMALILISHDPWVLRAMSNRILVMYAGQIVEQGSAVQILEHAVHPYTRALLACGLLNSTSLGQGAGKRRLPFIPGNAPNLLEPFPGCCFEARCPDRFDLCKSRDPKDVEVEKEHWVRCLHFEG